MSTFGIPFEDRVELAPAIDGWDKLAMGRELRAAFAGAAIRMATDAKAAAHAEARWGVLAGRDPAVYLNLGTGLAAAVVIGGQVVNGVNGAAGEIGYNLRSVADVGLALDRRPLLEHMVSGQALADRAAERGRQLTAADVFAAAAADQDLDGLIDDFVDELAFHLVNLANLVNPARIAVGGGIVRSWARIRPTAAARAAVGHPVPSRTRGRALPVRRAAARRGGDGRGRGERPRRGPGQARMPGGETHCIRTRSTPARRHDRTSRVPSRPTRRPSLCRCRASAGQTGRAPGARNTHRKG